ncbi:DUF4254 domain-containing protein [Nocardia sp. NPDC058518]|uniref:DUF4254 domain-containing protein n=1 Tax=Nocardia sp. NPDC058518 TaxID=3346534 RepID=UPI0036472BB4
MTTVLMNTPNDLPNWHQLNAALFCGPAAAGEHPIAQLACALAKLHRKRWTIYRPMVAAQRRRGLVDAIDGWIVNNLGTATHSVPLSVGALVDEMTRAGARARKLLATTDPAGDAVHAAWTACAALADQWTDLITHIPIRYELSTAGAH